MQLAASGPALLRLSCAASACRTTPSYVAFTDTERLIGDAAKNQAPHSLAALGMREVCGGVSGGGGRF